MTIEPYLFFNGRCQEALGFYQRALGARVEMIMRFKESPDPVPEGRVAANSDDKIMHASILVGGARLMASDGSCMGEPRFQGFSLSLAAPTEAEARRIFGALAEDGKVGMPIGKTFWSPCFGMVTDRFGVPWMITVAGPQS